MYYLTILTQFSCYYLKIQLSSYKKTDSKYPNTNGINEFVTLFYGWIYLFKAAFKYEGMTLENSSVLDVPTACVNTWKIPSVVRGVCPPPPPRKSKEM